MQFTGRHVCLAVSLPAFSPVPATNGVLHPKWCPRLRKTYPCESAPGTRLDSTHALITPGSNFHHG